MENILNARFEMEKFNGKINFKLWKLKMWDLLVQHGLHKALVDKTKNARMSDKKWEDLDARALSTIHLCLADEFIFNIMGGEWKLAYRE